MNWLERIRAQVFRPGESPEQADRRAFLLGATVTAAGLLVPKSIVNIPLLRDDADFIQRILDAGGDVPPGDYTVRRTITMRKGSIIGSRLEVRHSGVGVHMLGGAINYCHFVTPPLARIS